jgi:hypothetical protein
MGGKQTRDQRGTRIIVPSFEEASQIVDQLQKIKPTVSFTSMISITNSIFDQLEEID